MIYLNIFKMHFQASSNWSMVTYFTTLHFLNTFTNSFSPYAFWWKVINQFEWQANNFLCFLTPNANKNKIFLPNTTNKSTLINPFPIYGNNTGDWIANKCHNWEFYTVILTTQLQINFLFSTTTSYPTHIVTKQISKLSFPSVSHSAVFINNQKLVMAQAKVKGKE